MCSIPTFVPFKREDRPVCCILPPLQNKHLSCRTNGNVKQNKCNFCKPEFVSFFIFHFGPYINRKLEFFIVSLNLIKSESSLHPGEKSAKKGGGRVGRRNIYLKYRIKEILLPKYQLPSFTVKSMRNRTS